MVDNPTRGKQNPTVHTREVPNQRLNYHETAELPDGTPVGRVGAMWYVLDDQQDAISKGYHEIRPIAGDTFKGKLGDTTETFTV